MLRSLQYRTAVVLEFSISLDFWANIFIYEAQSRVREGGFKASAFH